MIRRIALKRPMPHATAEAGKGLRVIPTSAPPATKIPPLWRVWVESPVRDPADRGHDREPAASDEHARENVGRPVGAHVHTADGRCQNDGGDDGPADRYGPPRQVAVADAQHHQPEADRDEDDVAARKACCAWMLRYLQHLSGGGARPVDQVDD